ncbi:MAG: lamin tail domain-containing protein, partial [Candidatus Thorarchaeota archaeon]
PPVYSGAVKVIAYNIEESGINADWKDVVKEENPDILILVETGTWDDSGNNILNSVLTEFNAYFTDEDPYVGYCAQGITYSTSGEAILSRFPVIDFNQIGIVPLDDASNYDVTHDFIEAVVQINGTDIHIIGSHLKAQGGATNEGRRERETEGIINYMDNLGDVPIIYIGDLNSFSPDDTGPLAPLGDLGYGPITMMLYPEDPTYGQYSSTIHNFTDVFRTLNPTDPGHTYGHQNPSYSSRIDFILVNSFFESMLVNSTCGDTLTADTGSDHYSVDVFIIWNSTTDSDPPAQVTGLNATTVGLSQIDLEWNANSEPDLSYYVVYRNGTPVTTTASTFYNDTGLVSNTTYSYRVSAKDLSGNEGNKSAPANATTWDGGLPELVVLNEILPDPYVLYSEEWIELYNPQAYDVDMSGYILDDIVGGGTNPYTMPESTIISAGGFLLFNQSTTGVALNNAGDTVNLIKPDGITVQDSYTYASSSNDVSHGRLPDGSGSWTTMVTPTPGAPNVGALLVLNQILQWELWTSEFVSRE